MLFRSLSCDAIQHLQGQVQAEFLFAVNVIQEQRILQEVIQQIDDGVDLFVDGLKAFVDGIRLCHGSDRVAVQVHCSVTGFNPLILN